jgi:flagellum-specific peptidoglycan hydrolase FlgJ
MRIKILLTAALFLPSFTIPKVYKNYCKEHLYKAQLLEAAIGVPTSIQLAQAIAESGGGRSNIAKKALNHFGIRAGDHWAGDVYKTTSGTWRKYPTIEEGYLDHACFLSDYYGGAIGRPWSYWVKHCRGYGGPGYWEKIGKIIKLYKLYKYDL